MADMIFPPLDVYAIDEQMNRRTGSIPYTSLTWHRRYTEPGEFLMVIPADIYDPSWCYINTDDRPEMAIIQKVEFSDTSTVRDGIDTITLSGYFLETILNRIVFLAESPEQQKVYVPKPRRPSYKKSQNPKVYADPVGGLYYTNSSGDIVSADDGRVVIEDGLTEVDYKDAFGNSFGSDTTYCNYSYYDADKTSGVDTITQVNVFGDEKTYNVEFRDDRGNVFYRDDSGRLSQAVGVVEKRGDTYWVKKKQWEALPDDDPYGRYYLKTVKGPWAADRDDGARHRRRLHRHRDEVGAPDDGRLDHLRGAGDRRRPEGGRPELPIPRRPPLQDALRGRSEPQATLR